MMPPPEKQLWPGRNSEPLLHQPGNALRAHGFRAAMCADPAYLRAEAERCRQLSRHMQAEHARQMMLRMAEEFDVLATKADQRVHADAERA